VSLKGPLSLLTLHRTSPPDQEVLAPCSQQAADGFAAKANGDIAAPFNIHNSCLHASASVALDGYAHPRLSHPQCPSSEWPVHAGGGGYNEIHV